MSPKINVSDLKLNKDNPRSIEDEKLEKLKKSIKEFPKMMTLRPIVVDSDNVVIAGNMRLKAIVKLGMKDIPPDWVKKAEDLTEAEKKEFIVKDNLAFGSWDWEVLKEDWDLDQLENWGLEAMEAMEVEGKTETEKLSKLEFEDIYYTPEKIPEINLDDCIDTEKMEKKLDVVEKADVSEDIRDVLKLFCYRFLKIDFQRVADFYSFNATEEEKKVIERLRMVLVDSGNIAGFIEDDILRMHNVTEAWRETE